LQRSGRLQIKNVLSPASSGAGGSRYDQQQGNEYYAGSRAIDLNRHERLQNKSF
jgi:hypothetical protein